MRSRKRKVCLTGDTLGRTARMKHIRPQTVWVSTDSVEGFRSAEIFRFSGDTSAFSADKSGMPREFYDLPDFPVFCKLTEAGCFGLLRHERVPCAVVTLTS